MSYYRERLSGAQYQIIADEEKRKENEVLTATPKIDTYFSKQNCVQNESPLISRFSIFNSKPNTPDNITEAETNAPINIPGDKQGDLCQINSIVINHSFCTPNDIQQLDIQVNDDPAFWNVNETLIKAILQQGFKQNMDINYSSTQRFINKRNRYLSKSLFYRELANGEKQLRAWLIYSTNLNALFCGPCKLFGESQPMTTGYTDWSNVHQRLKEHEQSRTHKTNVITITPRSNLAKSINVSLSEHIKSDIQYWHDVLKRIVTVVRSLASRGLAFSGSDENFGSLHNGNYMMALELIAEFDPFLAAHIKNYGNVGRVNVSYLSSITCNEFIALMSKTLLNRIIAEVQEAKYYSISVDSTPDLAHTDQLTFIIRYVDKTATVRERFIKFIPDCGHKSEKLTSAILTVLQENNLDIKNCRGQSYDNASNMFGIYSGVQMRIKNVCPLAEYVPCSGHSLNLVGKCAAECCLLAVKVVSNVQQLYNFFSASTNRWKQLKFKLEEIKTVKNLSTSRWSAWYEALRALVDSWNEILSVLLGISVNEHEKPLTRMEAKGLYTSLNSLENCLITIFLNDILKRFNCVNKTLQSPSTDLKTVATLYQSLIVFVSKMRSEVIFQNYENKAKELSGINEYTLNISRKRPRKNFHDELGISQNTEFSGSDNIRINVYYVILDNLKSNLEKRCESYSKLNNE